MNYSNGPGPVIIDFGKEPLTANIEQLTLSNRLFRRALWTGSKLQVTLMNILPGNDVGLEIHENTDQFFYVESGYAKVLMGKCKDNLDYIERCQHGYCIIIPAHTWHNVINIGRAPLKLFSIYAPPEHPFGTVQKTQQDFEEAD